jgi:hypothetical protein
VVLIDTTISNNTSSDIDSGSIYNDAGTIAIENTVIAANNNAATAAEIYSFSGAVVTFTVANLLSRQTARLMVWQTTVAPLRPWPLCLVLPRLIRRW